MVPLKLFPSPTTAAAIAKKPELTPGLFTQQAQISFQSFEETLQDHPWSYVAAPASFGVLFFSLLLSFLNPPRANFAN